MQDRTNEIPSLSTTLIPLAATSSSISTRWSSSRFTSSTYRIPRFAAASRPGSKVRLPVCSAFSMCRLPTNLSSVAFSGNSTNGVGRKAVWTVPCPPRPAISRPSHVKGARGSELKGHPSTTSSGGSNWASARAAVDLPVPFRPRTSTPPIDGSTAFRIRAVFMADCSTIAENG